jgi:hypothetical protein
MPVPGDLNIAELFEMHHSPIAVATRRERATFFDDTRSWVDPNGYRLSDRLWKQRADLRRDLDNMVRAAISRGDDGIKVAKDIENFLNPRYAPTRSAKGRIIRDGRKGVLTAKPRDGMGSYPARRLMRTEITRAHGEATKAVARKLGTALRWRLSGSHPKPDRCDSNAQGGSRGLPKSTPGGVYYPQDFPAYPNHPQDLCHIQHYMLQGDNEIVARLRVDYGLADEAEAAAYRNSANLAQQLRAKGKAVPDSLFDPDNLRFKPQIAEVPKRPEWRASMNADDAQAWAADSVDQRVYSHATTNAGAEGIARDGFDLSRKATGRMFGDGVYMADNASVVEKYAAMFGDDAARIRLRINVGNQLEMDGRIIGQRGGGWGGVDMIKVSDHANGGDIVRIYGELRDTRIKMFDELAKLPTPNYPGMTAEQRARISELQDILNSPPYDDIDAAATTIWARENGVDSLRIYNSGVDQTVVFDPKRVTVIEE